MPASLRPFQTGMLIPDLQGYTYTLEVTRPVGASSRHWLLPPPPAPIFKANLHCRAVLAGVACGRRSQAG